LSKILTEQVRFVSLILTRHKFSLTLYPFSFIDTTSQGVDHNLIEELEELKRTYVNFDTLFLSTQTFSIEKKRKFSSFPVLFLVLKTITLTSPLCAHELTQIKCLDYQVFLHFGSWSKASKSTHWSNKQSSGSEHIV
jgi:hypothetical protein